MFVLQVMEMLMVFLFLMEMKIIKYGLRRRPI